MSREISSVCQKARSVPMKSVVRKIVAGRPCLRRTGKASVVVVAPAVIEGDHAAWPPGRASGAPVVDQGTQGHDLEVALEEGEVTLEGRERHDHPRLRVVQRRLPLLEHPMVREDDRGVASRPRPQGNVPAIPCGAGREPAHAWRSVWRQRSRRCPDDRDHPLDVPRCHPGMRGQGQDAGGDRSSRPDSAPGQAPDTALMPGMSPIGVGYDALALIPASRRRASSDARWARSRARIGKRRYTGLGARQRRAASRYRRRPRVPTADGRRGRVASRCRRRRAGRTRSASRRLVRRELGHRELGLEV